jgi:hypothetical protein
MRTTHSVIFVAATLSAGLAAGAAAAQGLFSTPLQCSVLPAVQLPCILIVCQTLPAQIAITNTLATRIPAGTVYTYVLDGIARTYRNNAALDPTRGFTIASPVADPPGTCTASIPGSPYTINLNQAPVLQMAP